MATPEEKMMLIVGKKTRTGALLFCAIPHVQGRGYMPEFLLTARANLSLSGIVISCRYQNLQL